MSKKTKSKQSKKERELKKLKRREKRKSKINLMKNFFPIDMINNAQDFCEKLFTHLKRKNFKFEINLAMMSVLGRMIGRHNLIIFNFYPFMIRYMYPHQKEISRILAFIAESCHEMVPPDDLEPMLKHLIDQFITERCHEEKITMGLHTIRAVCEKVPYAINEFSLNYCCSFNRYKEKNVAAAARSLINYYRDVNPDILEKKYRGRFDMLDKKEDRKPTIYGEFKYQERINDANLLGEGNIGSGNFFTFVK